MMKIIFLNVWNAKMRGNLTEFLKEHIEDTDVFCLQEVYPDAKQLFEEILADYSHVSADKFVTKDDEFPQSTYIKKGIDVVESGTVLADEANCGLGIYIRCKTMDADVYICNFHGMSRPVDKLDDDGRLKASQELINFFSDKSAHTIIGGDFNILPDTESIQMFANNGYRDLIREFGVKTTRNRLAWERYPDNIEYYSDYVFVGSNINVKGFSVPTNEVSDHLPLILNIDL